MNKNNQKGFANIVLIVVIVAVLAVGGYFVFVKKSEPIVQQPTPTPTQTNTPAPTPTPTPVTRPSSVNMQQNKVSIPEEYVKKTQDNANQATFVFAVPIKKQDIVGANIRYCVIGVSVGAQARGEQPACVETTLAKGFSLQYNENLKTLVVSAVEGIWKTEGPFRVGCAACMSVVEFSGIHTPDGLLLPKRMVNVY